MATTCVGLQSDGIVAVDVHDDEEHGWAFHQLTIAEAKFLHEELGEVLARADKKFPNGTPEKKDEDEEDEDEEDEDDE